MDKSKDAYDEILEELSNTIRTFDRAGTLNSEYEEGKADAYKEIYDLILFKTGRYKDLNAQDALNLLNRQLNK